MSMDERTPDDPRYCEQMARVMASESHCDDCQCGPCCQRETDEIKADPEAMAAIRQDRELSELPEKWERA